MNIPESYDRSSPDPLQPAPPVFLGDPALDALAHVTFELAAELWIVKNRLKALESTLSEEGRDISQEIESAYLDDPSIVRNDAERNPYVHRIFSELLKHGDVPR